MATITQQEASRRYYLRHRETYLEKQRVRHKVYRDAIKVFVDEVVKSLPCRDCGGSFAAPAMEFDHIIPPTNGRRIGQIRTNLTALRGELVKCELVCANCHNIRGHERGQHRGRNHVDR
jgi:5-methylcytosine-specific restriction endonuclease McrA